MKRTAFVVVWAGVAIFAWGSGRASAGCAVCTPDGECNQVETSGNCSCNVRFTNSGFQICRPQGVCDLADPNACEAYAPPPPMLRGVRLDVQGLRQLEELDPLVATAILAAADLTFAPDGTPLGSHLAYRVQEGTLRNLSEETGYSFRIVASEGEAGSQKLRGTLTSQAGGVIEFRADLRAGGRSGRLVIDRDSRGSRTPGSLDWGAERRPEAN